MDLSLYNYMKYGNNLSDKQYIIVNVLDHTYILKYLKKRKLTTIYNYCVPIELFMDDTNCLLFQVYEYANWWYVNNYNMDGNTIDEINEYYRAYISSYHNIENIVVIGKEKDLIKFKLKYII